MNGLQTLQCDCVRYGWKRWAAGNGREIVVAAGSRSKGFQSDIFRRFG